MGLDFTKGFNKFVEKNNELNHSLNKMIGKDVFKDAKKIDEPKDYAPFESLTGFSQAAPEQWPQIKGEEKTFAICGETISVPTALDAIVQYRPYFEKTAQYCTEQFKYRYQQCATDFDSFLHYFEEMYLEGYKEITQRAYSLLLTFGIFDMNLESFCSAHTERYNRAYSSFATIAGIEANINQRAANTGNVVGNAVQLQGGGFGFKGAMKGVAKAEAFNIGMNLFGKLVESQNRLSQEEKQALMDKFNVPLFYEEVYSDYYNTYMTLVQCLSDKGIISNVNTVVSNEAETIYNNLQNPMFPEDQFVPTVIKLISNNPFIKEFYELLEKKNLAPEETKALKEYFIG